MSFKNGHDLEPKEVECDICGNMGICKYIKGVGGAEALVCEDCIDDVCPDCGLVDCECNDIAEAERDEEADRQRDFGRGL